MFSGQKKCGGKGGGEDGSGAQKRGPAPSPPDAVGPNKKTSTPSTSDRSTKTKTTNLNLAQGTTVDVLSSYVKCGPRISKLLRLKKMMLK